MKTTRALLAIAGLAAALTLPACHADRTADDTHLYGYSPTGGPVYSDESDLDRDHRDPRYHAVVRDPNDRGYTPTGTPVYRDDGTMVIYRDREVNDLPETRAEYNRRVRGGESYDHYDHNVGR